MIIRHPLSDMLNEISGIFNDANSGTMRQRENSKKESHCWLPPADIKEEQDRFLLYIDVPGVDPENIEIAMENNVLVMKGAREEAPAEETSSFHRVERIKGKFYRRFALPETADADQVSAQCKHGVIEITVSKKKTSPLRKIPVKTAE